MIRKPTEQDFKESTAVTVLRETKRTAVETSNGVGRGFQNLSKVWLKGTFAFGILATALPAMASGQFLPGLLFLGLAFGVYKGAGALSKHGHKLPGVNQQPPPPAEPAALFVAARQQMAPVQSRARQSGTFVLAFPIAMRQAMTLGIPGLLLSLVGFGTVVALIPGLAMIATAVLILFKAVADRELVRFDHRSIMVDALLTKGSLDWARVVDVTARKQPWWNLKSLASTGSRRVVIVSGVDHQNAVKELLIPLDLLDLDEAGMTMLIADLLCCKAAAGDMVPSWQAQPVADYVPDYRPAPTIDPRESFDPDAIMARYMAEREKVIEQARPDLAEASIARPAAGAFPRRSFGRKAA